MPTAPRENGVTLDQFNDALRASPATQAFLQRQGFQPGQPVKLDGRQREAFKAELQKAGMVFPKGMEIDPAGNINQDQGMSKLWANPVFRWSVIGGAALATMGAAGFGPLAGALGGAGGGAGTAASVAGAAGAAGGTGAGIGGAAATAAGVGLTGQLVNYGLQYGLPTVGGLISAKMGSDATRDAAGLQNDYYNRALDAATEEQQYRRRFDEDTRDYGRRTSEEQQQYGRAQDTYGREGAEESLGYGRANDTYNRLSEEEKLAYGRSQDIEARNYGRQQYGNFVETLEPYRRAGTTATEHLSKLLGRPMDNSTPGSYLNLANTARQQGNTPLPSVPNRPTFDYQGQRPTWNYEQPTSVWSGRTPAAATSQPPTSGTPGQMVMIKSPDGEQRQVSAEEAEHYISRGARRVA